MIMMIYPYFITLYVLRNIATKLFADNVLKQRKIKLIILEIRQCTAICQTKLGTIPWLRACVAVSPIYITRTNWFRICFLACYIQLSGEGDQAPVRLGWRGHGEH
jgi:hypothetical protein